MKSRMVLIALAAGAAAVLWLLRRAGVDVPGNVWTILIAGVGIFALLAGLLLKLGVVSPNAFWGHSPLGTTLTGCGILLLVVAGWLGSFEAALGALPEALIGISGLVLFVGGLVLERKTRQGRKAPASE
jgi:peptidoglycan biosynthesis protein MviN/MurJ (putative lipid II flippase)